MLYNKNNNMISKKYYKTEIISIEGNIGSGKSSLIKILEDNLQKIIEDNKKKLSKKTYRKSFENNNHSNTAPKSNLNEILMENYTNNNFIENTDVENNNIDHDKTIVKRLINYIMQNAFGNRNIDWSKLKICFLAEPVDEWGSIVDENNSNILEKFYTNQKKYAFTFQMMAYITRLKQLREALNKNYDIIITERCVHTDKEVFAKMLYDNNKIEEIEYSVYKKWFEHFLEDIPKISIIYMQTEPTISHNRVIKRARPGEFISLDYLSQCHKYHENWLKKYISNNSTNKNILILNGNPDYTNNPDIINNWLEKIIEFIFKFNKN